MAATMQMFRCLIISSEHILNPPCTEWRDTEVEARVDGEAMLSVGTTNAYMVQEITILAPKLLEAPVVPTK
jgi:hypothetical protein